MLVLCLSWGFNQVAVKLALPDIPPLTMATLRSIGGLMVVLLVARLRGIDIFKRDGTLQAGLFAGVLFGLEFVVIYRGLVWTSASRAVVFLYVAPFVVALGSFRLGERLGPAQWGGLALSFAGVVLAIGVPQAGVDTRTIARRPDDRGRRDPVGGDHAGGQIVAALARAAPRRPWPISSRCRSRSWGSARCCRGNKFLPCPGRLRLCRWHTRPFWVVGLTFLFWFMLVRTYSASKLSAFTFITPLFGVAAGYFVLHDPLTLAFGAAAVLVIAGLFLVNRPQPDVR